MIVICKRHGSLPGILVSPDLSEKISNRLKISKKDYVKIDFEDTGRIVDAYFLSKQTAARFGFTKSETLPLTDDYPAYALEARPQCHECFKELLENSSSQE
jgi:hypothetical protein